MEIELVLHKFKKIKILTSFIIVILLQACSAAKSSNFYPCTGFPVDQLETSFPGTDFLILKILNIYDTPREDWNHTVSACSYGSNCNAVQYIFNHLELTDISVFEGAIVRVEIPYWRPLPLPSPLEVLNWELCHE